MTILEMQERRGEAATEAKAILDRADTAKRSLTEKEENDLDGLLSEGEMITRKLRLGDIETEMNTVGKRKVTPPQPSGDVISSRDFSNSNGTADIRSAITGQDTKGQPVYALRKEHRFVDYVQHMSGQNVDVRELSIGRCIQASITGRMDGLHPFEQRVMSGANNIVGGYLVPGELSATLIDLARAKSVLFELGAQIVPMSTDTLTMARVTADPTFAAKSENAAFTASDFSFDQLQFTANTIGVVVDASRELAEDAPNFAAMITEQLATGLAVKLDSLALTGNMGSDGITGLLNAPGVTENAVGGTAAWSHWLDSMAVLQIANHEPNGIVIHPTDRTTMATLAIDTNNYAVPPEDILKLPRLSTSAITVGSSIIGDFSQAVWGVRTEPRIEITTEAGDRFNKHQVGIKITWRGDFNLFHAVAFEKLTGITT